jgi:hypothetical protein
MSKNNKDNIEKLTQRIFKIIKSIPEDADANYFNEILDENNLLKNENEYFEERLEYFKTKYNNVRNRYSELITYCRDTKNKKDKLFIDNKNIINELETKKEEIKLYGHIIKKYKNRIALLNKTNCDLLTEIQLLKEEQEDKKMKNNIVVEQSGAGNENELSELYKIIDEKNKEVNELKNSNSKLINDIDILKKDNDRQETLNKDLLFSLMDIQKEYKEKEKLILKINEERDNYKNEIEKLKFINIELEIENNSLKKQIDNEVSKYESEYNSDYDTEYENESENDTETSYESETEKPQNIFRGNKNTRKITEHFFKDISKESKKRDEEEENKEIIQKEKIDYSFSTDYLCDMLHNSQKIRKDINNDNKDDKNINKNIFIKINKELESVKEELNEDLKEELEEAKEEIKEIKKKEVKNIIGQKSNLLASGLRGGNRKNNKLYELQDVDGELKLYIKNELYTITDQNIDKNDINEIKKSYNRKVKRNSRNKNI